ncbi:sugar transporter, partial [Perkinsus olseni]
LLVYKRTRWPLDLDNLALQFDDDVHDLPSSNNLITPLDDSKDISNIIPDGDNSASVRPVVPFAQISSLMTTSQHILGTLGAAVGMGLSLAPLPTMMDIINNKSIGDYTAMPYTVTLIQNLVWVLYGRVTPNREDIVIANALSAVVELSYCLIFWFYALTHKRRELAWLYATATGFLFLTVIVCKAADAGISASTSLGTIASALNALMYGSPLAVIGVVLRTRSIRYMPFLLSFMTLMCSIIWFAWSVVARDLFVLIPNILGLGLGLAQVVVWCYYRVYGDNLAEENSDDDAGANDDVELIE